MSDTPVQPTVGVGVSNPDKVGRDVGERRRADAHVHAVRIERLIKIIRVEHAHHVVLINAGERQTPESRSDFQSSEFTQALPRSH